MPLAADAELQKTILKEFQIIHKEFSKRKPCSSSGEYFHQSCAEYYIAEPGRNIPPCPSFIRRQIARRGL